MQYEQFPTPIPQPQIYPQFKMSVPQLAMTQQLQSHANQNPQRQTKIHVEHNSNPNNKTTLPIFNTKLQPFPTHVIMTTPLQGVQMRSRKVLQQKTPAITIEEEIDEEIDLNKSLNGSQPKE